MYGYLYIRYVLKGTKTQHSGHMGKKNVKLN